MKNVMCLVALAAATLLAGCAAQPSTAPPPAASPPVAAKLVPAAQTPAAPAATADATQKKVSIPYGYKRTVVNGTEIFCRNDLITGSRTERHQVCYTKAQLDDLQNNAANYINNVQRTGGEAIKTCTAGPGCN